MFFANWWRIESFLWCVDRTFEAWILPLICGRYQPETLSVWLNWIPMQSKIWSAEILFSLKSCPPVCALWRPNLSSPDRASNYLGTLPFVFISSISFSRSGWVIFSLQRRNFSDLSFFPDTRSTRNKKRNCWKIFWLMQQKAKGWSLRILTKLLYCFLFAVCSCVAACFLRKNIL